MSFRMIGSTDFIEGPYFIVAEDTPQAHITSYHSQAKSDIISIPKEAIRHFRLGHLSNKILLTLHHDFFVNHR